MWCSEDMSAIHGNPTRKRLYYYYLISFYGFASFISFAFIYIFSLGSCVHTGPFKLGCFFILILSFSPISVHQWLPDRLSTPYCFASKDSLLLPPHASPHSLDFFCYLCCLSCLIFQFVMFFKTTMIRQVSKSLDKESMLWWPKEYFWFPSVWTFLYALLMFSCKCQSFLWGLRFPHAIRNMQLVILEIYLELSLCVYGIVSVLTLWWIRALTLQCILSVIVWRDYEAYRVTMYFRDRINQNTLKSKHNKA